MAVLVTEAGFAPGRLDRRRVLPLDALLERRRTCRRRGWRSSFPNDRDPAELAPWLDRLALIRVAFPAMGDGRGFSIARRLRAMGYAGRLRAAGPLIADQFRVARRVGFDEVELPDAVADAPARGAVARCGRRAPTRTGCSPEPRGASAPSAGDAKAPRRVRHRGERRAGAVDRRAWLRSARGRWRWRRAPAAAWTPARALRALRRRLRASRSTAATTSRTR